MKTILAILLGGFVAGALDILSAFATYVPTGATEIGILQFIASGALGPDAFTGGAGAAAIGALIHFGLTTLMAAAYVLGARVLPVLTERAWICGALYGIVVYFLMTYAAVPLSRVEGWDPTPGWSMVSGLMAHIFYVGLPIALIARQFKT